MKTLILFLICSSVFAQAPMLIKGDMTIRYSTRTQLDGTKPKGGVEDRYTMNVNVANSALFRGTIDHRPLIKGMIGVSQSPQLTYTMELDVVNPANPSQTRNVGKLFGTVPITENNEYRFSDGSLKVGVFGIGSAKGFDSKFSGVAAGKPPATSGGIFEKIKKEALNITKSVNGKPVTIAVSKYDKMAFQNHILAAGPVQIYSEVSVNGEMVYDYGRMAWYFDGVTITYSVDGKQLQDKLNGNIRWSQQQGEYQFDIRVNEPPPTEASVFSGPADESAFFSSDSTIPALTGVMKYKDVTRNEVVESSAVQIELTGNKLTKQQMMYLSKLLFLSSIVPLNAE